MKITIIDEETTLDKELEKYYICLYKGKGNVFLKRIHNIQPSTNLAHTFATFLIAKYNELIREYESMVQRDNEVLKEYTVFIDGEKYECNCFIVLSPSFISIPTVMDSFNQGILLSFIYDNAGFWRSKSNALFSFSENQLTLDILYDNVK